jgi:hypothetical protein
MFITAAHTDSDVDQTLEPAEESLGAPSRAMESVLQGLQNRIDGFGPSYTDLSLLSRRRSLVPTAS